MSLPALAPGAPLLARGYAGALINKRFHVWEVSLWGASVLTVGIVAAFGHLGAFGALGGLFSWGTALGRIIPNIKLRRKLNRHKLHEELHPGSVQKLKGVVCNGATFDSPISPRRAVLGRFFGRSYLLRNNGLWKRRPRAIEELCGVDFDVQTATGKRVRVRVDTAYLVTATDENANLVGSPFTSRGVDDGTSSRIVELWREELICPGQTVELLGLLQESIDPEGVRAAVRAPPVLLTLRAPPGLPLLVRQVQDD